MFLQNHYGLRAVLKKPFFFKTENVNRILDSITKRFVGIEKIRWCWKAGENPHLPYMYHFFLILYDLKVI